MTKNKNKREIFISSYKIDATNRFSENITLKSLKIGTNAKICYPKHSVFFVAAVFSIISYCTFPVSLIKQKHPLPTPSSIDISPYQKKKILRHPAFQKKILPIPERNNHNVIISEYFDKLIRNVIRKTRFYC